MKKKYPSRYINIDINANYNDSITKYLPRKLFNKINKKISAINQRSYYDNQFESIRIFAVLSISGLLYFLLAFMLFHSLWYHVLICGYATFVYVYIRWNNYFEAIENSIKEELPNVCDKISHYYDHLDGNLPHVLKKTEERISPRSRIYITRIKDALSSDDYEYEITKVKNSMPFMWLKILCILILFAKRNGGTLYDENNNKLKRNVMSEVLELYSIIIEFNNLQQGYTDAEMKGYENILLYAPFVVVAVVKGYYTLFSQYIDVISVYDSIEAHTLVALLFFACSTGALFLRWIRNNQN